MKAAQYNNYGDPEVIEITDVPKPTVNPEQLLVEVHGASINPFDYKLRRGYMKEMIPLKLPVTIGGDFSGLLIEEGTSEFNQGDEVYGQSLILNGGSGAIAEYAIVKEKHIAKKPKNVTHVEAASLVLVGVSVIQALEEHLKLKKGQKIFINGGSGGIGSTAIQLAKSIGAYVATTVSTSHIEFVKSLGADEVIDYKTQNFNDVLKEYDAVYDTVGGETATNLFKIVRKEGVIVSMVGKPNPELAKQKQIISIGQNTQITTQRLNKLTELVEKGTIKPQIDKVFPFDQTKEAYTYTETNHPQGKVVIKIKE